jgi:hypothetical protein
MNPDLFEEEFAMAAAANAATEALHQITQRSAAIARRTSALVMRRAKSESELASLLPPVLKKGTSYHVISAGNIDSFSFIRHIVKGIPIDFLMLSTWCMLLDDAKCLFALQAAGRIDQIRLCFGEIMPISYPETYDYVAKMERDSRCKVAIARNHSKIMLGYNVDQDAAYVVESSANINTNPRIEQTAIHTSKRLYEFYEDFFLQLKYDRKIPEA